MDKNFVKFIVTKKNDNDDRLIKKGDLIDLELVEILCQSKVSNIPKAFYTYKEERTVRGSNDYSMEVKCPSCNGIHKIKASKTTVIDTIRKIKADMTGEHKTSYFSAKELLCDECMRKKKEKQRHDNIESEINYREKIKKETQSYIDLMLNPDKMFSKQITPREKIYMIMSPNVYLDDDMIQETIVNMDYYDFLKTPYWDGVRNYKLKESDYRCQLCGKKGILSVHHNTYENHGLEHIKSIANNDLIVLCKACHEKFHDVIEK